MNFKVDVKEGDSTISNCTEKCPKESRMDAGKNICLTCKHFNVDNDCISK